MTLSAIELSETHLIFDYTMINNSPHPVYLLNNLSAGHNSGDFQVDSSAIFAELAPGPILSLSKRLIIMPPEFEVDTADIPFVSILESRWTMSETLRLALPIEERFPSLPEAPFGEARIIPQFTFTLGYVIEDQPLALEAISLSDDSRHLRPEYGSHLDLLL